MYDADILCEKGKWRSQIMSSSIYVLKSGNSFFFLNYSAYNTRAFCLIFKYIFLEFNPLWNLSINHKSRVKANYVKGHYDPWN